MTLAKYKAKRSFEETPEPEGGNPAKSDLKFVIQKHDASHLHYDFRLEMKGVLKSWAVPKGPSTDPSVKRLAMMVEDHPYDYRTFEGIIPKGQYGGGTVIVWDEGNYLPVGIEKGADKSAAEKILLKQLREGNLKFVLNGKKLKGEYHLVKTKGLAENGWLLMKAKDRYASVTDITKKEKSVISGKTIPQMEKSPDKVYGSNKVKKKAAEEKAKPVKKNVSPKPEAVKKASADVQQILKKATRQAQPAKLSPMLATLTDEPFDANGWIYEIKWDGYRAVAFMKKNKVELLSRNNKSFNEKFYPIHDALAKMKMNAVLDGEIVAVDEKGPANFGMLQNWRSEADGILQYYVFDLLWYEGKSLVHLPLKDRRAVLKAVLHETDNILISKEYETSGIEFFKAAEKLGLEGIMAKKKDSVYIPGSRSDEWLKIKTSLRHEVVIGGFTKNDDSPKLFSSLLVGLYEKGKFIYTGKIGTGFNDKTQREMMKQFRPLIISSSPFDTVPDVNKPSRFRPDPPHAKATWLKPQLVCEVSYREVTSDGVMRHPSFEGMRTDKNAKSVKKETAVKKDTLTGKKKATAGKANRLIAAPKKTGRKTLLNPTEDTQVKKISGHELKFTHVNKIFWPKEKLTKGDMINYYYQMAPYILPYLKDRPQSLNRFPNGITGMSFYQKDVTGKVPGWVAKYPYVTQGEHKNFMLCNDEATLLYMASLGAIEMNPWSSTVKKPDHPDWCVIDLDPDKNHFDKVIETARVTKEILDAAGADCYCKTSGSTGIHIYIPLGKKYDYETSKEFGRLIAHLVNERLPSFTSIERATKDRRGKLYIDFLQNRPQATLAAAYSLRPKPGATVSMPLHWDEIKKGMKMTDFNIHNAYERVNAMGDIFKPVLGKGISMRAVLKKLNEMGSS